MAIGSVGGVAYSVVFLLLLLLRFPFDRSIYFVDDEGFRPKLRLLCVIGGRRGYICSVEVFYDLKRLTFAILRCL